MVRRAISRKAAPRADRPLPGTGTPAPSARPIRRRGRTHRRRPPPCSRQRKRGHRSAACRFRAGMAEHFADLRVAAGAGNARHQAGQGVRVRHPLGCPAFRRTAEVDELHVEAAHHASRRGTCRPAAPAPCPRWAAGSWWRPWRTSGARAWVALLGPSSFRRRTNSATSASDDIGAIRPDAASTRDAALGVCRSLLALVRPAGGLVLAIRGHGGCASKRRTQSLSDKDGVCAGARQCGLAADHGL